MLLTWLPRLALLLSPIVLAVLLLAVLGEYPALVGAGVFALLAEMVTSNPHLRRMDPLPVVCSLPLVSGGFVRTPARTAFLAFATGYLGVGLAASLPAVAAFLGALAMLLLDTAFYYYLGCFAHTRLLVTAAVAAVAGALFRYAIQVGPGRKQSGCTRC